MTPEETVVIGSDAPVETGEVGTATQDPAKPTTDGTDAAQTGKTAPVEGDGKPTEAAKDEEYTPQIDAAAWERKIRHANGEIKSLRGKLTAAEKENAELKQATGARRRAEPVIEDADEGEDDLDPRFVQTRNEARQAITELAALKREIAAFRNERAEAEEAAIHNRATDEAVSTVVGAVIAPFAKGANEEQTARLTRIAGAMTRLALDDLAGELDLDPLQTPDLLKLASAENMTRVANAVYGDLKGLVGELAARQVKDNQEAQRLTKLNSDGVTGTPAPPDLQKLPMRERMDYATKIAQRLDQQSGRAA